MKQLALHRSFSPKSTTLACDGSTVRHQGKGDRAVPAKETLLVGGIGAITLHQSLIRKVTLDVPPYCTHGN
jgi:hypothetical protein